MRLCILITIFLLNIGYAQAKTTVYDARFWASPDKTRLVLDIGKSTSYQLKKDNKKAVLTLNSINLTHKAFKSLQQYKDNRLTRIFIKRNQTNMHLIFDTTDVVGVKSFKLKPNSKYNFHRLVLDFYINKKSVKISKKEAIVHKKIIVIDPGHGGEDPGSIGQRKSYEKHITLNIAKKLAKLLNKSGQYKALLTRKYDYYIPLYGRIKLAQKYKASLFISIHADSVRNKTARGASVYTLSHKGATTKFAKQLAKNENAVDKFGGVQNLIAKDNYLSEILWEFSSSNRDKQSQKLARNILKQLRKLDKLHKDKPQKAGFVVLKTPAIPSVLVETAFISNKKDEARLTSERGQAFIAKAIFQGVENYYQTILN